MKKIVLLLQLFVLSACIFNPTGSLPSPAPTQVVVPTAEPATPTPSPGSGTVPPLTADNFAIGVRISSRVTAAQIAFINQNYHYVMTPFLGQAVREAVQGPQLILYRSIQGTWTDFDHFDWGHIDAHENMFLHHHGEHILTRWDSWLMDPGDMVAAGAPDALDHWINYYAVTAAEQVYQYNYDGLFIDSASHWLNPWAVYDKMPDDYDAAA